MISFIPAHVYVLCRESHFENVSLEDQCICFEIEGVYASEADAWAELGNICLYDGFKNCAREITIHENTVTISITTPANVVKIYRWVIKKRELIIDERTNFNPLPSVLYNDYYNMRKGLIDIP